MTFTKNETYNLPEVLISSMERIPFSRFNWGIIEILKRVTDALE